MTESAPEGLEEPSHPTNKECICGKKLSIENEPTYHELAFCLICNVEVFILSVVRASSREHHLWSEGFHFEFPGARTQEEMQGPGTSLQGRGGLAGRPTWLMQTGCVIKLKPLKGFTVFLLLTLNCATKIHFPTGTWLRSFPFERLASLWAASLPKWKITFCLMSSGICDQE